MKTGRPRKRQVPQLTAKDLLDKGAIKLGTCIEYTGIKMRMGGGGNISVHMEGYIKDLSTWPFILTDADETVHISSIDKWDGMGLQELILAFME